MNRRFDGRNIMISRALIPTIVLLALSGCGATIRGTVQLIDNRDQPVANESPKGTVVNMINTSAAVCSASVTRFSSCFTCSRRSRSSSCVCAHAS